jgi:hypothetical protein
MCKKFKSQRLAVAALIFRTPVRQVAKQNRTSPPVERSNPEPLTGV